MDQSGRADAGDERRQNPGVARAANDAIQSDRAADLLREARAMPADDPRRAAASIAMFDRLSEHWSLRGEEREKLLGGISKSTWSEWKQRPMVARVKVDTRERIANMYAIDLNAHSLFAPEFADRWVRQPNLAFRGESPMAVMLGGKVEDIVSVRLYLEGIRTSSTPITDSRQTVSESAAEQTTLASLQHAVGILEHLVDQRPGEFESALASALVSLGTYLVESGDVAAAVGTLRHAIEIRRNVDSTKALYRVTMRLSQMTEAETLSAAMDVIEARHPQNAQQFSVAWDDVFAKLDSGKANAATSTRSASL